MSEPTVDVSAVERRSGLSKESGETVSEYLARVGDAHDIEDDLVSDVQDLHSRLQFSPDSPDEAELAQFEAFLDRLGSTSVDTDERPISADSSTDSTSTSIGTTGSTDTPAPDARATEETTADGADTATSAPPDTSERDTDQSTDEAGVTVESDGTSGPEAPSSTATTPAANTGTEASGAARTEANEASDGTISDPRAPAVGAADRLVSRFPDVQTPFSRDDVGVEWTFDSWWPVVAVVAFLTVAGVVVRLGMVDRYPLHGDEAIYVNAIRRFHDTGQVTYEPFIHGIFVYYLTYFGYPTHALFDSMLLWVRWIIATSWLLALPLLLFAREELGDVAVIVGAAVLAVHQFAVRSSVLFRHDPMLASLLLLNLVLYLRLVRTRSRATAVALGVSAAAAIATTEHAYVLAPTLVAPIVGLVAVDWLATGRSDERAVRRDDIFGLDLDRLAEVVDHYVPLKHLVSLVVALVATLAFLFAEWPLTVEGLVTFPQTMYDGIEFGLRYGGNPTPKGPFYYLGYLGQTPLVLLLGLAGLATTVRRRRFTLARLLLASWFVLGLLVFSLVLSRQRPYYVIYMLTPLALLAGLGVQDLLVLARERAPTDWPRLRIAGVVLAATVVVALTASGAAYAAVGVGGPQEDYVGGYYWQEDDLFDRVGAVAAEHDCSRVGWVAADARIYSIPRYHLYPVEFHPLSGVTDTPPANLSLWPAVLVSKDTVPAWDTSNTTVRTVGQWHIYAPRDGCSD